MNSNPPIRATLLRPVSVRFRVDGDPTAPDGRDATEEDLREAGYVRPERIYDRLAALVADLMDLSYGDDEIPPFSVGGALVGLLKEFVDEKWLNERSAIADVIECCAPRGCDEATALAVFDRFREILSETLP